MRRFRVSLRARFAAIVALAVLPGFLIASFAASAQRFVGGMTAGVVAVVGALVVTHWVVTRPIRQLVSVTRHLGRGDLSARSGMDSEDEIGVLGRSIDAMAADLQTRDKERADLISAVVRAGELERRRIAADVHDDSIQVMSAHVMGLQLLRREVADPQLASRIAELEETGRAATRRLRDLVFELHSPILEERGLCAAVDALWERMFEGQDVAYEIVDDTGSEPPMSIRATAYRIVQEALANVRAHAQARSVHVALRRDGDDLVLRVADDGRGFVPSDDPPPPGHLGLLAARERAAAVGGAVAVDSRPGAGTILVCRLPWSLDPADERAPTRGEAARGRRRAGRRSP